MSETLVSFSGWVRQRGQRWKLFCRAATEAACWEEILRRGPRFHDKLVRCGDRNPSEDGKR